MKIKRLSKVISLFLLFFLSINAYAGNYMKAGETLKQDSYVFNIEEATALMNKYSFLEEEFDKNQSLIESYKELDLIQQNQKTNLEDLLKTRELQIAEYQKIKELDEGRIKQLNKEATTSKLERWGFFSLGVGLTIGSILIADRIDDVVESNARSPGLTLLKF